MNPSESQSQELQTHLSRPGQTGPHLVTTRRVSPGGPHTPLESQPRDAAALAADLDELRHAFDHATHLLPAQGPITVFVHHNTLHAFEDLTFEEAVVKGGRIFGCNPYLPEERYRDKLARGRIRQEDLAAEVMDQLGDQADDLVGVLGTRYHLRLAMLAHPLSLAAANELRWYVAESDALLKMRPDTPSEYHSRVIEETRLWVLRDLRLGRPGAGAGDQRVQSLVQELFSQFGRDEIESWTDATWESFYLHMLWRICRQGVHSVPQPPSSRKQPLRHRDLLLKTTGIDIDLSIHEVLIRFCSAFLDQGLSPWHLPQRKAGFWASFCALYGDARVSGEPWLQGLPAELQRINAQGLSPLESIHESLNVLGVSREHWDDKISATLLALRGWAGMIWQVEIRGDRVAQGTPPGSLLEFLAVRLVLERLATAHVARRELGYRGPLNGLRRAPELQRSRQENKLVEERAFQVFQLAQVLGWKPAQLARLTKNEWAQLVNEIEQFNGLERRRIYHLAFERRYRTATLDALAVRGAMPNRRPAAPQFQVVTCIDEREESFRRHLEEAAPDAETFGAAGFFSVPMYYRGAADAHFVPLCPVVIVPQHFVQEVVDESLLRQEALRGRLRRWLGKATHQAHVGSRTFALGALLSALFGALASIPLVARIIAPRLAAQVRKRLGQIVQPPPLTQLKLERSEATPGPENGHLGWTPVEMANSVERLMRDMGLTERFSRLVIVLGHRSTSLNNPHRSAYDCGACSGSSGGPNARALAHVANDPRVRALLAERGIQIPEGTWFVGGVHNTCDDSVTLFDLDRLPSDHRDDFNVARAALDEARKRNAHERCRRFESAPLSLTTEAALRHVEARSEDLSQARPECGHATNAVCFVGRRERTRGLFMDRRTFLVSYDATKDTAESEILTRILQAVVPVCGGINLEYYFSYTDPAGFGCGTKLPHNITSLLGVMDGAASDLRTGLPWQMVEIHEPVRLLFVLESTPEAVRQIMQAQPAIGDFIRRGWVQLATLDPASAEIHLWRNDTFERYHPDVHDLPEVQASQDWYGGWRDHLEYALVAEAGDATTSTAMTSTAATER